MWWRSPSASATDPELLAKGEELKTELLAHPDVRAWLASLWGEVKRNTVSALDDPDSELRQRLTGSLSNLGRRLATELELQAKVDDWVERAAGYVVDHYRGEVADLIAAHRRQVGRQGHGASESSCRSVATCSSSASTARSSAVSPAW